VYGVDSDQDAREDHDDLDEAGLGWTRLHAATISRLEPA
jgi:hypothetical protein